MYLSNTIFFKRETTLFIFLFISAFTFWQPPLAFLRPTAKLQIYVLQYKLDSTQSSWLSRAKTQITNLVTTAPSCGIRRIDHFTIDYKNMSLREMYIYYLF